MLERSLILFVLLSAIFFLLKKIFIYKPSGLNNFFPGFAGINSGLPTIIYFWTEQCSQCFNLQNPVLSKLKQKQYSFNLISYNALNEKEIVNKLNIKTVPATAVLSKENEIRFINNGFAGEELLHSQLKQVSMI
jgi:thiol-disulfide isomerase/thioredoxin